MLSPHREPEETGSQVSPGRTVGLKTNQFVWTLSRILGCQSDTFTQLKAFFLFFWIKITFICFVFLTLPGCYCENPLSGSLSFMSHQCNVVSLAGLQDVVATR